MIVRDSIEHETNTRREIAQVADHPIVAIAAKHLVRSKRGTLTFRRSGIKQVLAALNRRKLDASFCEAGRALLHLAFALDTEFASPRPAAMLVHVVVYALRKRNSASNAQLEGLVGQANRFLQFSADRRNRRIFDETPSRVLTVRADAFRFRRRV